MVLHEVTRNATPTSEKIGRWVADSAATLLATRTCKHYHDGLAQGGASPRKTDLGELAAQEAMNEMALATPATTGVFLFEDHKIARASFMLPDNCRKVGTRAWLLFLEGKGWIESVAAVERAAINAGRAFSRLRFPP